MSKLTVILLGNELVTQDEDDQAAAVITPGMLLTYDGSGNLIPHGTAGARAMPAFALEREELGQDMNDDYAVGDTVKRGVCPAGVRVNALIASGQNITKGAYLESAGNGTLRSVSVGATSIAQAQESVNNSAGPGNARLRVTSL